MGLLRRQRDPVLVVAQGDGWLEVYAQKHIDVQVRIAPWCPGPQGELLAQEYVRLGLPYRFRDVYEPGNLRRTELIRQILPSDIALRNDERAVFQELTSWQDYYVPRKKWQLLHKVTTFHHD